MVTNIVNTLLYPFIAYFFIGYLNLGVIGCALTDVVSISITYLTNLVYTAMLEDLKEARGSWSITEAGNFREQSKLAFWSVINSVIEGYSWQLMILVAGYLGVAEQAANSIIMNVVVLLFAFNVGMMHSSCTLIG